MLFYRCRKGTGTERKEPTMTTKNTNTTSATFENMPEIEVGTVLVTDRGWSMVLPTFYRVVARTESSIWTKEIRAITAASDEYGTSGTKVADLADDSWKVDRRTCKRSFIKGRSYANVEGHYASVWDGKPKMYDYMD